MTPRIDWLVAVCPHPPGAMGQKNKAVVEWTCNMIAFRDALVMHGGLWAAVFLLPYQWLPKIGDGVTQGRCAGWQWSCFALHNSCHGGSTEMDHHAIVSMPSETHAKFSQPLVTAERPGALAGVMD